jgi:hypothetical protein
VPRSPATCPRRLLLVTPVTAWTTRHRAPGQGHGALIPEAQCSGSLALPYVGLVDALEERRADGTALAGTFDHKQAVVDLAGFADELGQMLEPGQDPTSAGLLITVSMRSALPSFRYCWPGCA